MYKEGQGKQRYTFIDKVFNESLDKFRKDLKSTIALEAAVSNQLLFFSLVIFVLVPFLLFVLVLVLIFDCHVLVLVPLPLKKWKIYISSIDVFSFFSFFEDSPLKTPMGN